MKRGLNQSIDTKHATSLLCDALELIESGRAESARAVILHSLSLLPEIDRLTQEIATNEFRESRKRRRAA